jgi:hypothetical protein
MEENKLLEEEERSPESNPLTLFLHPMSIFAIHLKKQYAS